MNRDVERDRDMGEIGKVATHRSITVVGRQAAKEERRDSRLAVTLDGVLYSVWSIRMGRTGGLLLLLFFSLLRWAVVVGQQRRQPGLCCLGWFRGGSRVGWKRECGTVGAD